MRSKKSIVNSILKKVFHFLASIKLAVILLIFFAILLSWATFFESEHGTDAVQQYVYKTLWFDLFLYLLGINVTLSALSRFPWKKHHVGFLITHLGILIILIGALITRQFGIEGQIMLQEGEETDEILLDQTVLTVSVPRLNVRENFNPWFINKSIPKGQEILYRIGDTGMKLYVTDYYENPQQRMRVTNDGDPGHPAIQFSILQPGQQRPNLQEWLLAGHEQHEVLELRGAKIFFHEIQNQDQLDQVLAEPVEEEAAPTGELVFLDEEENEIQTLDVEELMQTPVTFTHDEKEYTVQADTFYSHATIREGQLIDDKEGNVLNPALRFSLEGPEKTENHLSFAFFPDLESMHGGQEQNMSGLNARFDYPSNINMLQPENQIDLAVDQDRTLYYRAMNKDGKYATGTIQVGQNFNTTWGSFVMRIDNFYENGRLSHDIIDAGKNAEGQQNNPIIQVRLEYNGKSVRRNVSFNNPTTLAVGGEACVINFGRERYPLGFNLELIDFRAPRYPGTNRPAKFESLVKLKDPEQNLEEETLIYMNNPLGHNNFLVYQSSYIEGDENRPDISIFSVARAPGTPIIYFGSIVMILGMIIIFASSRYGRRRTIPFQNES